MKKRTLPKIVITLCVSFLICLISGTAKSQISYIAISSTNDTTTFSVTSDFPIKLSTGDTTADNIKYSDAVLQWKNNNSIINNLEIPTWVTPGIKKIYFLIPVSEFDLFTEERKTAIKANPDLYLIK